VRRRRSSPPLTAAVTEPWITPNLYDSVAGGDARIIDEYTLCKYGQGKAKAALQQHWATFCASSAPRRQLIAQTRPTTSARSRPPG